MKSETNGITEIINAIRTLTGVGICYYDLNAFFQYDKYGAKNNRGHYCAFCEKARSLPGGRKNCDQSDRFETIELATKQIEEMYNTINANHIEQSNILSEILNVN